MSKIELTYPPGATPLDPNETQGLIPDYISTQGELNLLEQDNILDAVSWAHCFMIQNIGSNIKFIPGTNWPRDFTIDLWSFMLLPTEIGDMQG